jgi:DNA polymerase III alpha subunit
VYAELHCHSNFSFLDGASHPEELAEEAARLGLTALALTDHDGFYGIVRFAETARPLGLPTVFGAELTLGAHDPPNGVADPPGEHLVVLAEGTQGYARLARSARQLAGQKGAPTPSLAPRGDARRPVGCAHRMPQGTVPGHCYATARRGPGAASVGAFGRDRVVVRAGP